MVLRKRCCGAGGLSGVPRGVSGVRGKKVRGSGANDLQAERKVAIVTGSPDRNVTRERSEAVGGEKRKKKSPGVFVLT